MTERQDAGQRTAAGHDTRYTMLAEIEQDCLRDCCHTDECRQRRDLMAGRAELRAMRERAS